MKFKIAQNRMKDYESQRDKLLVLSASLLILVILETLCFLLKNERVIILPPEVRREFWAQGNRFSPEYLEEQASYLAHLALDVNQENHAYNTEILMRYADVNTYSYLREKFEKHHKILKQNDASTRFDIKKIKVVPDRNKVYLTGIMNNFVGTKSIKTKPENYVVEFKVQRGRLFLKDFRLITEATDDK